MREKIVFIGGDSRQAAAAARVAERGYSVSVWGIADAKELSVIERFSSAYDADVLVLPLPMSSDGVRVNCSGNLRDVAPRIDDVFANAKNIPVLAGRISPKIKSDAERLGVRLYDYYLSEELMIKNACLTAEGAVALAMNEQGISLVSACVGVIGYGRIGKFLARMLHSLGASVTVAARKGTDLAYASSFGYGALKIAHSNGKSTLTSLSKCDIIFNTAPHWLIDADVLEKFDPETLIIDLASAPGGVDPDAAKKYGIRVISAQGLPGKYAPLTAGSFVGDAICEMLPRL